MALLQGSGGTTGKRARIDRQRSSETESGPLLRSLLPGSEGADLRDGIDLRAEAGPDLRIERAPRFSTAALEAALLRLAAAGPTLSDVLEQLAEDAALLLKAPARVALVTNDRLVWTTGSAGAATPLGVEVAVERTACGAAWRTGLIQNVAAPVAADVIRLDRPQPPTDDAEELTTNCCGAVPVVLAVPLLREAPKLVGRHAGPFHEVFAVLALGGARSDWFDDDDIEASADLAEVAGERIAALALLGATAAAPGPALGESRGRRGLTTGSIPVANGVLKSRSDGMPGPDMSDPNRAPNSDWMPGPEVPTPNAVSTSDEESDSNRTSERGREPEPSAQAETESAAVTADVSVADWDSMLVPPPAGDEKVAPEDILPPNPVFELMPVTARSVDVVPASRPGRSGFVGWFTRSAKMASTRAIPSQRKAKAGRSANALRVLPEVADPTSPTSIPGPPSARPSVTLSRSGTGFELAESDPVLLELAAPEAAEPESPGSERPELEAPEPERLEPERPGSEGAGSERPGFERPGSERPEPERPEPERPEPERPGSEGAGFERPESERRGSERSRAELPGFEPAACATGADVRSDDAVRIEPIPRRLVRSETVHAVAAVPRLSRARPQAATGTPMPPAMPAADSMGLWQWDAVSGECTWSSPVARLLGLDPEAELTLAIVRQAVVAADRGRFDVAVQAITSGRGAAGALRLKTPDGRAKHAYAWSEVRRDGSDRVLGAWGGVVDVTAFEHDAAALRSGLAGLRAAQELTGLATWEWRVDAGTLIWSDEMYRLAGVSAETFTPTPEGWHAFVHPDDLHRARRLDLGADLDARPRPDGERVETFRLIGRGGEIRHVQSWSATSNDRVVYGATIDVTRQVHDRMTLERLSATDPVTGLGNRLAFDRRMQQLLSHNGSTGSAPPVGPSRSVTLILLDLDRFKVVNDSLGHQVGDRLLIEVARRLVAVVPEGSVTARMGGDEFVVVPPPGGTEAEVGRLAGSIVEALRAPYVLPETGELLVCPASLGVATSEGRRVTGHDLLREADIALYRAKDSGRDRFVVFDEALKARTKTRQRAERRLRNALEAGRLVMEYQPVVDFSNGQVIGAEGLVRLHDTEDSDRLISPDLFLDIAEQTGLVVEIDCWVIETAIRQLMSWTGLGDEPSPWLAINLSARSLEHPRVVRRLVEAVKHGEVDRERIKIELTEQSFVGNLPGVDAAVRQLIASGIAVGIDDFGTGYSALAYLQHFDLDFMKIDRTFVSSVGEGPRGDAVVTAIVDLAHAHGMRVIAEGVESGRQARRLREIGCDFAQGFHFGRPGEADRIVRG